MTMKKKVFTIILLFALFTVTILWGSGVVPKQIGKIYGMKEVQKQFPEKNLQFKEIEWSKFHGDYVITFTDSYESSYSCIIGPCYFPCSLGQGIVAWEEH